MNRGTSRNSKKAPRPPKVKKPRAGIDGDPQEWAIAEIRKTRAYIDQANAYLEKQFARALKEPDNSVEILRLQKAFEARQDRALRIRLETNGSGVPQEDRGPGRRRLDLSSPLGTEGQEEDQPRAPESLPPV